MPKVVGHAYNPHPYKKKVNGFYQFRKVTRTGSGVTGLDHPGQLRALLHGLSE